MRSRLMLLPALSHSAELLIPDEPMEGLDPAANEEVPPELMGLAHHRHVFMDSRKAEGPCPG